MKKINSAHWSWYLKKYTVEDGYILPIKFISSNLLPGNSGQISWKSNESLIASMEYSVLGSDKLSTAIRLSYIINRHSVECEIRLIATPLPWGGHRYWFQCPLNCKRKVANLYLPPNDFYFACRRCHHLTYRSSQHNGACDRVLKQAGLELFREDPYLITRDTEALINEKNKSHIHRMGSDKARRFDSNLPVPHAEYLTKKELCQRSSLPPDKLKLLTDFHLITPDFDGKYRPKLLGWAKKLVYLLDHGWEPTEIKLWASGRFRTDNPRQWPPDHDVWKIKS